MKTLILKKKNAIAKKHGKPCADPENSVGCVCVCVCVCGGGGVLPSMDLLSREPIGPERKPIYPLVIFQRESGHPHPNTLRIRLETIDSRDFVMIILASILALCLYIRAGGQLGLRGVGGSHFFFIRRLGPSIYRTPPKNISSTPKTIWIFSNPKNTPPPPFCTLTLRKDLKMHRNDPPKYSPIWWWIPQKYPQISIPKNIHFSENPRKYWNSKFWTPKNWPEPTPPPPPPPLGVWVEGRLKYMN